MVNRQATIIFVYQYDLKTLRHFLIYSSLLQERKNSHRFTRNKEVNFTYSRVASLIDLENMVFGCKRPFHYCSILNANEPSSICASVSRHLEQMKNCKFCHIGYLFCKLGCHMPCIPIYDVKKRQNNLQFYHFDTFHCI